MKRDTTIGLQHQSTRRHQVLIHLRWCMGNVGQDQSHIKMISQTSSAHRGETNQRLVSIPPRKGSMRLKIDTAIEEDDSTLYDSPISPSSTAPSWRPERASTQSALSAETCNGPHTPRAESVSLPIQEDLDEGLGLGYRVGSQQGLWISGTSMLDGSDSAVNDKSTWWEDTVSHLILYHRVGSVWPSPVAKSNVTWALRQAPC